MRDQTKCRVCGGTLSRYEYTACYSAHETCVRTEHRRTLGLSDRAQELAFGPARLADGTAVRPDGTLVRRGNR